MAEALASTDGELRRFILERHPVRGFWVRLDAAWRELRSHHRYDPPVETLLGETVTAAVLLAATLKFKGTLSLQLAGDGLVKLLVAQCTHRFEIRALARPQEGPIESAAFRELVGDGRLTVTIEAEERAARYQGIVEVRGDTLAQCLESYFATSEQLQTRIAIATDTSRAAGLLLQKLPTAQSLGEATAAVSHDAWEDLESRAAKLDATLLRLGTPEEVLTSVCGEHDCRMFSGTPVHFVCRCSPERVTDLLRGLGADELRGVLAEQGAVTVTCEYCGRPYRFDAVDVERLFADGATPDAPRSLN